jgi:glutaryl-CoA dehydrogenase
MLTKAIYKSTFAKQAQRSYVGVEKLVKFNWEDPFLIENQLTEDEKMIRDSAR